MPTSTRKRGRPRKLNREQHRLVIRMLKKGETYPAIVGELAKLGVSITTQTISNINNQ